MIEKTGGTYCEEDGKADTTGRDMDAEILASDPTTTTGWNAVSGDVERLFQHATDTL